VPDKENTVSQTDQSLSINQRLDLYELARKTSETTAPLDLDLYSGPQRANNDQTTGQIRRAYVKDVNERLDTHGVPRLRGQCTPEQQAYLDRPNPKMRNSYLSGSYLGMRDELTLNQRIDLGMAFYGQYMLSLSEPNQHMYDEATYKVMYRGWVGDVHAACDNVRVPRYLKECTPAESTHLHVKMAEREMDEADLKRNAEAAKIDPWVMDTFRELAAKHPIRIAPHPIRPLGDLDTVPFDWPIRSVAQVFDPVIHLSEVKLGNGPHRFKTYKSRPRGAEKVHWVIDDVPTWGTLDSFSEFEEFNRRDVELRLPKGYAEGLHTAYSPLALDQRYDFAKPFIWQMPRRTGKRTMLQALFWARNSNWGSGNWPLTPAAGFYLHACHEAVYENRRSMNYYGAALYYGGIVKEYQRLAREHLYPNFNKAKAHVEQTNRTSRNPHRRK
jgi:hypothetical protein